MLVPALALPDRMYGAYLLYDTDTAFSREPHQTMAQHLAH